MKDQVLALDGVFDTGLAVLDALQTANELAAMSGLASPRFEVALVGVHRAVKTAQGFTVPGAAQGRRVAMSDRLSRACRARSMRRRQCRQTRSPAPALGRERPARRRPEPLALAGDQQRQPGGRGSDEQP